MDTLVGVSADAAAVQAIEPWLIQPIMGLLIALAPSGKSVSAVVRRGRSCKGCQMMNPTFKAVRYQLQASALFQSIDILKRRDSL